MSDLMRASFVGKIPPERENGVLYVSRRYDTAVHNCACGCGNKVVTPLGRSRWRISGGEHDVSLFPSVANNAFACKSHYFIQDGHVDWSSTLTERQVARSVTSDFEDRSHYYQSRSIRGRVRKIGEAIRGLLRRRSTQ